MERGIISIKKITLLLTTIIAIILCLSTKVFAANDTNEYCYLSDIKYQSAKVGWGSLSLDKTSANTLISMYVDGNLVNFKKGIFAHATSTLIYDLTSYDYDYFSTYYGVNTTSGNKGNGVKFYIYTSKDGKTWNLKTPENPQAMMSNNNAQFITIDIREEKYLKLYAYDNGANGNDHAVYADSKLYKEGYNPNVTKTVEEYDELIKSKYTGEIDEELELLLLQRNLVKKAGQYTLKNFIEDDPKNKETFDWIMNNKEALKLYTVGGKPDGTYERALNVLSNLYKTYKSDLNDETIFTNNFGEVKAKDLYLKMMLALSLTHSTDVYLWVDSSSKSDAVTRYEIYKNMHLNGKLNNDIFENLTVEEMRWVVNNIIDDEEIEWLNDLMKKRNLNDGHGAYQFITYRNGYNYTKEQYYSAENYAKWDEKYDLSSHNITYLAGHPRLWIVFEEGSVCGGLAKTWSNMRATRGIPSSVVGQPGHAAAITYSLDNNGNGIWNLVNDVSGWANSGRTERIGIRMPNEWGEYNIATYGATLKPDSYVILAQQAQNEYEKYEASEIVLLLEDVYKDDHQAIDAIYKKALAEEEINFDALYGLVMLYKNDNTFTEEECYKLAEKIAKTYTYHPLPMYDLLRTLNTRFTSPNYKARVAVLQDEALKKAIVATSNDTLQYQVSRTVANTILGLTDNTIANFSFDGENAGKIILSSRFDASEVRWDYSLDGGQNWKQTSEKQVTLTKEEISSITEENDIKVHIVGVNYDDENIYTIDIKKANAPSGLYNNDLENRVIGVTDTMEWKFENSNTWTSYKTAAPDLTGNKTVQVRIGATGAYLPSDFITMSFTEDNQKDSRKYVPVSHLSVHSFSSEASSNKQYARYAIDANINTMWHTNWNGSDKERYIVIKLDNPIYFSALEYVPRKDSANGRIKNGIVFVSGNAEDWTQVATISNWGNNQNIKSVELEESVEAQYIKLQATDNYGSGSFLSALMINIYEDKDGQRPRADIEYSNTGETTKAVTAKLVNPTKEITITNNDGKDTYTFTENGEFTFEFVDSEGRKGTKKATVTWIKDFAFALNGEDAGKIILSDKFEASNLEWKYSLDGGVTWKNASGLEHKLENEEIDNLNPQTDLKIHIIKSNDITDLYYTIDIQPPEGLPSTLYANDFENKVIGMTDDMEWRMAGDEKWISYEVQKPDLTGNKEIEIRRSAKGLVPASSSVTFTFTQDNYQATKVYLPIEHLSIHSFSSQSLDTNRPNYAPNAIDGNLKTQWHTNYAVAEEDEFSFITIKLDEPKYISQIEYFHMQDSNEKYGYLKDASIYTSIDGEEWKKVKSVENLTKDSESKIIELDQPEFTQYVKITMKSHDNVFATAAMLNFYYDSTKEIPVAKVEYDITNKTNKEVTANLLVEKDELIVINNDGKNTYTFTENGEFIFEYKDKNGIIGLTKAEVDWIDKQAPTVEISYSTEETTTENVIATFNFNEEVRILTQNFNIEKQEDGSYTYRFFENLSFKLEFEDLAGNKGEEMVLVNWIDKTSVVAQIEYSTTTNTSTPVTAKLVTTKPVTITNNAGNDTYTFIENGEFTFEFVDENENKGAMTALVTWIVKEEEKYFTSNVYNIQNNEISQIKDKTTFAEFKKNISTNKELKLIDKKGNIVDDTAFVATGMTLKADDTPYTIIVKGDLDGDGEITANDLAKMKLHLIGNINLKDAYLKAANLDKDNEITANDLARIKLYLIGLLEIKY